MSERKPGAAFYAMLILVAGLLTYSLSFGPACYLCEKNILSTESCLGDVPTDDLARPERSGPRSQADCRVCGVVRRPETSRGRLAERRVERVGSEDFARGRTSEARFCLTDRLRVCPRNRVKAVPRRAASGFSAGHHHGGASWPLIAFSSSRESGIARIRHGISYLFL